MKGNEDRKTEIWLMWQLACQPNSTNEPPPCLCINHQNSTSRTLDFFAFNSVLMEMMEICFTPPNSRVDCLRRCATKPSASFSSSRRVAELSSGRQTAQWGTLNVGGLTRTPKSTSGARVLQIRCLDAAMPFDSEFKLVRENHGAGPNDKLLNSATPQAA